MFFKTTLTVPKIKDLVNSPNQKYQDIYNTISHKPPSYTDIDLLPSEESPVNMKDELKLFLKKQLKTESDNIVIAMDSIAGNFSNF